MNDEVVGINLTGFIITEVPPNSILVVKIPGQYALDAKAVRDQLVARNIPNIADVIVLHGECEIGILAAKAGE
jgi:hypothetical protein